MIRNVFTNLFDARVIIPSRLADYGLAVKEALAALPDGATYADIVKAIGDALDELGKEGSDVSVNLIEQKEDTSSVSNFISDFIDYMRTNEMTIGAAMGGAQSAGYKAFYPFGMSEYARVTRKVMPDITRRLQQVTVKWGSKLPADMQQTLQGFKDGWDAVRSKQKGQMSTVQIDRTQHSAAYTKLQLVLTKAVHKFGYENPGNEALGNKVFPEHLLYSDSRKRHVQLKGTLATYETTTLLNRKLSARINFLVHNTSLTSDLILWLAATPDSAAPASAVMVKAGETRNIKASQLGDLAGTFVMISNDSTANTAGYDITISGLPKDKKEKAVKKEKKGKEANNPDGPGNPADDNKEISVA